MAHFPEGDQRLQISRDGGSEVRWRRDGKELYYLALEGQMMAGDVQLGTTLKLGPRRPSFSSGIAFNPRPDQYAVSADGQRFLLKRLTVEGSRLPLTVVVNWPGLINH